MRKIITRKVAQIMFAAMLTIGFSVTAVAAPQETIKNTDVPDMNVGNILAPFVSESAKIDGLLPRKETVFGDGARKTSGELDVFQKMLEFIVHDDKPTGIIIDARGYNLEPTFSPLIYDEAGNIIYGKDNVDKEKAISQGLVEYAIDLEGGFKSVRVGENPLVINAIAAKDGCNSSNRVNVVVSMADAERIRKAESGDGVLTRMAVVFVR